MTARFQKLLEIVIVAMICYQQKSASADPTLFPEDCGIVKMDRIVHGEEAAMGAYPWMTLLGRAKDKITWFCGGALITEKYVLTAAHCVNINRVMLQDRLKHGLARLGEHNLVEDPDCPYLDKCLPSPQDFRFEEIIPHSDFDVNLGVNDIALIRLKGRPVLGRSVSTLCLPQPNKDAIEFLNGRNAVTAGWGTTEDGHASHVLMMVELPLNPIEKCRKVFGILSPSQLCSGGTYQGSAPCYGDSGGPMFQIDENNPKYVMLGITSFGRSSCGSVNAPSVFTNVAYYMDFIKDNVKP